MKRITTFAICLMMILSVAAITWAYNETNPMPFSVDATKPTEGNTAPSEMNDSVREIKVMYQKDRAIVVKAANYSILNTDSTVLVNGTYTVTLPNVAAVSNSAITKPFTVVNIGTGVVTINTAGASQTIDGTDYSSTGYSLPDRYSSLIVVANGTAWYSISRPGAAALLDNSVSTSKIQNSSINTSKLQTNLGINTPVINSPVYNGTATGTLNFNTTTITKDTHEIAIISNAQSAKSTTGTSITTSPTELLTMAVTGNVTAGDLIYVQAFVKAVKGATTGPLVCSVSKKTGTATITFIGDDATALATYGNVFATDTGRVSVSGIVAVTGSGSLTFALSSVSQGSNSTNDESQIQIYFLKRQ